MSGRLRIDPGGCICSGDAVGKALERRAKRALERQLVYQQGKAERIRGEEAAIVSNMMARSAAVREKLSALRPISARARVLEVGSGAHGLIFYFEGAEKVGVDPLADEYRGLFPAWQGRATTIAAFGERLPFPDESFDVVLCDNVVDHAESPRRIVEEIARVLSPGGLIYFTVNIHHPLYQWAASAHAAWRAAGLPFEITPFADHTVHLTLSAARRLFEGLPLTALRESDTIALTRRQRPHIRHVGDRLKQLFFKNALYELIAVRD
jgi:SAM-dependent methyltransferase